MDGTLCPLTCVCLPGMWHCRPVGDRQLGLELRSISRYVDNVTVAVKKSRAFTGGWTRREELVASAVNLTRIMKKYHDLTTGCPHLYVSGSVSASVTTAWGILWVLSWKPFSVCVSKCVCVWEREISDCSGIALFCSVSFLFPSFSWSKKSCLKVTALCYQAPPSEYKNSWLLFCQRPDKT